MMKKYVFESFFDRNKIKTSNIVIKLESLDKCSRNSIAILIFKIRDCLVYFVDDILSVGKN